MENVEIILKYNHSTTATVSSSISSSVFKTLWWPPYGSPTHLVHPASVSVDADYQCIDKSNEHDKIKHFPGICVSLFFLFHEINLRTFVWNCIWLGCEYGCEWGYCLSSNWQHFRYRFSSVFVWLKWQVNDLLPSC